MRKTRNAFAILLLIFIGNIFFINAGVVPLKSNATEQEIHKGRLQIITGDNFNAKKSHDLYFLNDGNKSVQLRFNKDQIGKLKSGLDIKVTGEVSDGTLNVSGFEAITTDSSTAQVDSVGGYADLAVAGPQNIVVLNLNFIKGGNTISTPYSNSTLQSAIFSGSSSVNAFYQKSSFNSISLNGDVFGPFNIDVSSLGFCDLGNWHLLADAAATSAGVNLANYKEKIYMIPDGSACGAGYGGFGGGGMAFIMAPYGTNQTVVGHEIGHALGMGHAQSVSGGEYGDASCIMANPMPASYPNAPHKVFMGWIPAERVQTIAASGTYKVATSDADTSAVQALRILDPSSLSGDAYYVSFRTTAGFQSREISSTYAKKVSVHQCSADNCSTTKLITLMSNNGETFSAATGGLHLRVESLGSTDAFVRASFGVDTEAPSRPAAVSAIISSGGRYKNTVLEVSWTASSDNYGVSYYEIHYKFPDGTDHLATTSLTKYQLKLYTKGTYEAYVIAVDGSGNKSVPSLVARATY